MKMSPMSGKQILAVLALLIAITAIISTYAFLEIVIAILLLAVCNLM